jgi:8-oxo-dGTP pyrophosphatase MutT (NUDIX family)
MCLKITSNGHSKHVGVFRGKVEPEEDFFSALIKEIEEEFHC